MPQESKNWKRKRDSSTNSLGSSSNSESSIQDGNSFPKGKCKENKPPKSGNCRARCPHCNSMNYKPKTLSIHIEQNHLGSSNQGPEKKKPPQKPVKGPCGTKTQSKKKASKCKYIWLPLRNKSGSNSSYKDHKHQALVLQRLSEMPFARMKNDNSSTVQLQQNNYNIPSA